MWGGKGFNVFYQFTDKAYDHLWGVKTKEEKEEEVVEREGEIFFKEK